MEPEPENQNNNEIEKQEEENGEENDQVLDDDYLLQLHQYLQEMKRQRKQAELDANLLGGRLRVLRDEEKKTLKKIEVTRKKNRKQNESTSTTRRRTQKENGIQKQKTTRIRKIT